MAADRTGLPALEAALLDTLARAGATADRDRRGCEDLLALFDGWHGCGPRYGYPVLVDLVQPWTVPLPLVDGEGNFGSIDDDPPADAVYTECRLSPAGQLAVAAARGDGPPVPIGLVNGTTYRGGQHPPYDPGRIAGAVLLAATDPDASDEDLVAAAGPPAFPTGCEVDGDLAALAAGQDSWLRLTAILRAAPDRRRPAVDLTSLPPRTAPSTVVSQLIALRRIPEHVAARHPDLAGRARLPLLDAQDLTTSRTGVLIRCTLAPDADLAATTARIRDVWSVSLRLRVRLRAPLAGLLRGWVAAHGPGPAADGARALAATLR